MQQGEEKELTIEDFFLLCENEGGSYQIDTPQGWKDINFLIKKSNKESYDIVLESGINLECSADHYVLTHNRGWVRTEDIDVQNDVVITREGHEFVVSKEYLGIKNTFDLNVNSDEHSYYSNNIVSHNTGKSMVSDALAGLYQMPLLRLDIGALFSSHVGESEENVRKCVAIASSISPCVLWVDEIEKGIGGVQSSNVTDGGVTNRVFGTLLTWMQEKTQPIFIICTANNVTSIPPEFMRAGRFDEVFFLDLPNKEQRSEVISVLLKRKHRDPKNFDLNQISDATKNYSPAEIEKCINNGLFIAYQDNKRELSTKDIVGESSKVQPLYNSRREEIEEMREWALGKDGVGARARLANSTSSTKSFAVTETGRQFDIGQSDDLMSGISDIDL